MAEFLLEIYVPRADHDAVTRGAQRARLAAQRHSGRGAAVRYVRSIFLPEEETWLVLYQAANADAVRAAARDADLHFERIIGAVEQR
jgi:Protein of unknown function (DUF4242)